MKKPNGRMRPGFLWVFEWFLAKCQVQLVRLMKNNNKPQANTPLRNDSRNDAPTVLHEGLRWREEGGARFKTGAERPPSERKVYGNGETRAELEARHDPAWERVAACRVDM